MMIPVFFLLALVISGGQVQGLLQCANPVNGLLGADGLCLQLCADPLCSLLGGLTGQQSETSGDKQTCQDKCRQGIQHLDKCDSQALVRVFADVCPRVPLLTICLLSCGCCPENSKDCNQKCQSGGVKVVGDLPVVGQVLNGVRVARHAHNKTGNDSNQWNGQSGQRPWNGQWQNQNQNQQTGQGQKPGHGQQPGSNGQNQQFGQVQRPGQGQNQQPGSWQNQQSGQNQPGNGQQQNQQPEWQKPSASQVWPSKDAWQTYYGKPNPAYGNQQNSGSQWSPNNPNGAQLNEYPYRPYGYPGQQGYPSPSNQFQNGQGPENRPWQNQEQNGNGQGWVPVWPNQNRPGFENNQVPPGQQSNGQAGQGQNFGFGSQWQTGTNGNQANQGQEEKKQTKN